MRNTYEVRGDTVAVKIKSPKWGDQEALIDAADLLLVSSYPGTWHLSTPHGADSRYRYAVGIHQVNGRVTRTAMHRFITQPEPALVVDHANHNGLDNRRQNLRVVSRGANCLNLSGPNPNNVHSGLRGVRLNPRTNKWIAAVRVEGKDRRLGTFTNKHEAAEVVQTFVDNYINGSITNGN